MSRKKKKRKRRRPGPRRRRPKKDRKKKPQGGKRRPARATPGEDALLDDMLPLFPLLEDASSPLESMEQLMIAIVGSENLIDEPEFEDIFLDPMLCVETLAEAAEESDIAPESLSQMSEEELFDTRLDLLEMTTERLLTDELRQDIVHGLNALRLRFKRSGERDKVAQVAALQSFLSFDESSELWATIGLVQAIVQRSLATGSELLDASVEIMGADHLDEEDEPSTLLERFAESGLAEKADTLLRKVPGLSGFVERQADKHWEEGLEALSTGELYLGLFTLEEIVASADIIKTALAGDAAGEIDTQELLTRRPSQKELREVVLQIEAYVIELVTPERLKALRARLRTALDEPAYRGEWLPFIYMLNEYMADENAVENETGVLVRAFVGEMGAAAAASEEAEE